MLEFAQEDPGEEVIAQEKAAQETRKEQHRIKSELLKAGIDEDCRFYNSRLDNYQTPTANHVKALAICRNALNGFVHGDGLLLLGEPGGGKTHLLVGMLYEAIASRMSAKFITAEGFFVGLRSCIGGSRTEEDYIASLTQFKVIALDDIYCLAAAKSANEESYQYRMLWHLLDRRYFAGKATLVSTNHGLEKFKGMIDERTRRRLQATIVAVPKRTALCPT